MSMWSEISTARASALLRFFGVSFQAVPSHDSLPSQYNRNARYPWRFTLTLQAITAPLSFSRWSTRFELAGPSVHGFPPHHAPNEPQCSVSRLRLQPVELVSSPACHELLAALSRSLYRLYSKVSLMSNCDVPKVYLLGACRADSEGVAITYLRAIGMPPAISSWI